MTSDLSIFATRLREFIGICMDDLAQDVQPADRAWLEHADAEFNALAMVLFARQFKHNAPYRRICETRKIFPNQTTHWTQIPAAPTAAFKEWEMTCLPPDERSVVFHSSSTTKQKPSRHFHNAESLAVYEASLWPWFERYVVPDFKSQISNLELCILTPPPAQAPHSSLVHMFETVRRKLGAPDAAYLGRLNNDGAWTLDFDSSLAALKDNSKLNSDKSRAGTQNSKLLLGTAFSFVHLLDFLAEKNVRLELPTGSCVMETGGYKGRSRSLPKAELHSLITERLGVPPSHIICEYGMSELSSQAYDSGIDPTRNPKPETRNFIFPPWARAQIISPETGREVADGGTGLLRVFDLANVFSVLAIQTEDLGIRRSEGFELIGRAEPAEPRGCSLLSVELSNRRTAALE